MVWTARLTLVTPYCCIEHRTRRRQTSACTCRVQGKSRKKSQYIVCDLHTFRIIVSAPNGTAPDGTAVDNTGLLYLCPIIQGDCEPLNGDNGGPDRKLYDIDGQYMLLNGYTIFYNLQLLNISTIKSVLLLCSQ